VGQTADPRAPSGFDVAADAYDSFMGRYSRRLAPAFADFATVRSGLRALDVGCGTGALTTVLVERLGTGAVSAVDPSPPFVATMRDRHPALDVRHAPAESLPYGDGEYDAALAQLVVHFMADPVAGLREMARVTRPGGVVAACVWDHAGGGTPLAVFWEAALELDPGAHDESGLAGAREGHLAELLAEAGLRDVEEGVVTAAVAHATFDDWWEPFTFGVGPAGAYALGLAPERRDALRERCRERLGVGFTINGRAWAARGVVA
jgi:SAM-dependent methyltransferase